MELQPLKELLTEEGEAFIERDHFEWPVYYATLSNGSFHQITFTEEFFILYNIYIRVLKE